MKFAWLRSLVALLFGVVWTGAAYATAAPEQQQRRLLLVNAPYPPYVNPEKHPSGEGIDIEIAREALRRGGGYEVDVRMVPWARALMMLEHGEADLTTTASRNGDRSRFLAWSQGYRSAVHYGFFARKGATFRLAALGDLDGRRLGVARGFFLPEAVTQRRGVKLVEANDIHMAVAMLEASRTDAVVLNATAGAWEIEEAGLADRLERQPLSYSSGSPTYMAFARARGDHEILRDAMNRGLAAMAADGSIARIEAQYMKWRRKP